MGGNPVRDRENSFFIEKNVYAVEKYPDYPDGELVYLRVFSFLIHQSSNFYYQKNNYLGSAYIITTDLAELFYKSNLNHHFPPFTTW